MRQRLTPDSFALPVEAIKQGYYSDSYFLRTSEILNKDNHHPRVLMQIFQRQSAVLCGMDEAIAVLKKCAHQPEELTIHALYDGDPIDPWETVMTIEGDLANFSHLETVYLGVISRQTKIATNVQRVVKAANGKPVLFFPSRFDHYSVQASDGYAAHIGGIYGVSTPANGSLWGAPALGTIPHALIAAYEGNTVAATNAFDKYIDPSINRVALVDFDNDCVSTALAVAKELGDKLSAVRLDTADNLVDVSVIPQMGHFKPTGVCHQLVTNVREALDREGFGHVGIMVSGGFTAEKITQFEALNIPVDVYAVGSSLFNDNINFTADIVMVNGQPCSKVGRSYRPNPRLALVK
ncbi:MAG TPA: nicotinate phosphoribosyltransferase [Methylomusa anaerophila]|uniref:nicotinate phosphoribosyltransferase n=1 Tax=Methylomusa anaerophila TaxID=1930071 RepID=A0A348AQ56_9FIRM|nr:nicotinate phosphoribosyltransferase [Methylomusa anaerophila]BBB93204.1 nicotinate phosphoribosyltransferase pncB1 [Methylomusa anaerophila]HML86964.1 nicotinate phosphoribosyltransferase [Methylomusa anaerophila]